MRTVALAAGESFALLLVIVEPLGNVPVFVSLTGDLPAPRRRREALATALIVAAILLVFMLVGEPLLHYFGISLESLQVAGGLVIAVAGFQMTVGVPALGTGSSEEGASIAFTPMAIPLLAGPGAMAAVIGLDARDAGSLKYVGFAVGIVAVAFIVYGCMLGASWITERIGPAVVDAMTRVVGLFVLAIGVEMIIHGIATHGALTHLHKL
jgi:multiple antibiotic resistance protein